MVMYCCGVTFETEFGELDCTDYFYDSVEALKEANKEFKCYRQCGIVEFEFDGPGIPKTMADIKSFRWVEPQDMGWGTPKD
jgi:hypothetical protein